MTDVTRIRVSDAERESVVVRLQHATAEGRLSLDELGDRTYEAYAAVTRHDLEQLVDDLPPPEPAAAPGPEPEPDVSAAGASAALSFTILAMGLASVPIAFTSEVGPALGLATVVLAVLTLSLRRGTSRRNRAAILGGVAAGLLTPVFFLYLLLMLAG